MMKVQTYRVYFNRRGAPRSQAWSVDTGEGTERRHFRELELKTKAFTVYNGKNPDWENPIAWLVVTGALNVRGERASITRGGCR